MRTLSVVTVILALAASTISAQTTGDTGEGYLGSEACAGCHRDLYEDFAGSGHPLKIQKIDGMPPVYPAGTSPGVPSPPVGMEWLDISYVIGGYGWKARFMDREGFILTGPQDRQLDLANENLGLPASWSGYDPEKGTRKAYNCGACHTTGWVETGPEGPHQDGLPGIHGTWEEPGVTCEACHGPGAAHAASPAKERLTKEPNCASCHVRGDVAKIDASKGLIRHHEQYEDLLASPHRELGCLACHDPHKSTKYGLGGYKGEDATCRICHQDQATMTLAMEVHGDCVSCHMPFAGKSAVSIVISFEGGTVPKGDIRSHIFRIASDPDWKMFTDDGDFVRLDGEGRAFLALQYACLSCHVKRDLAWAGNNVLRIHGRQ